MQANSDKTPFIADLKPSGKYVMADVHKVRHVVAPYELVVYRSWLLQTALSAVADSAGFVQVGGIPAVMKYLLQKGYLDGSCLTVTGEPSHYLSSN